MNLHDFEAVWKRQELPRGAEADLATLHATFATKNRKLAATLLVRDLAEASAGVVGALAFAFIWWKHGRAGWPIGVAIVLVLGVTGFFVRERIRAHGRRLGADAPLLTKLEADLTELRHQRRLLLAIWRWYLGPIGAAVAIVTLTIAHSRPYVDGIFLGGYFTFSGLLFWAIAWMNRRAVRKQLDPRIAELEKLKADFISP